MMTVQVLSISQAATCLDVSKGWEKAKVLHIPAPGGAYRGGGQNVPRPHPGSATGNIDRFSIYGYLEFFLGY